MFGRFGRVLTFFAALMVIAPALHADEGMWLYNQLPVTQLKEKYGFEPTAEWAEHLMKSSVRFNNGGSGSFVSSDGLVLTNHHVAADTLHKISTSQNDYLKEGFLAGTRAEEIPAPDLELNQLLSIEDVTARVKAAVKPDMDASQAAEARRAVIAEIERESLERTGLRSNVVTLYKGGAYHLYRYKKYTDVRVVFAPETASAFFGGDPDNFEYPRYNLDMTLMRVYENGEPAKLNHYLKWSESGAAEGELVFVSGHPGSTNRIYTTEALVFLRDVFFPYRLKVLKHLEILLQQYGQESPEHKRRAEDYLFGVQNSRKAYTGMLKGLQDPAFMARKQREEYDLRVRVENTPELRGAADAWETVEKAKQAHGRLLEPYSLFEQGYAFDSRLFEIARALVRMADEDQKPNEERLAEYQTSNRASLEQDLFSTAPIYKDLEVARLSGALSFLAASLGEDNALVQRILGGHSPHELAVKLVEGTSLADPAVRRFLAQGGAPRMAKSYDPMIRFARLVDPVARKWRKRYEAEVAEPERQAYAQISSALFSLRGRNMYPDATFTLRLAYGVVKGYEEDGVTIPPWTTMGGAFAHEARHQGRDPWKLPESWHRARSVLDPDVPLNFVSTPDIVGGNSGSPVVNRAGELVGLIFDGNIQSLTFNYAYSEEQARAVSVHSAGMLEALEKIYGADHLVREIRQ